MLEGTFTSPKIRRLAAVLGVPWPHAIGLAGLLWRFAGKHAPTGEIGRHDDEDIATALEWPGDSTDLVAAFVRSRLLDPVAGPARLLVHDWPDHAPRYVKATLHRNGKDFSPLYDEATTEATTVETTVPDTVSPTAGTSYSYSYASTSTSTSSSTSPARVRLDPEWADLIWSVWVPGRKSGRKVGIAAIERSIRSTAKREGIELKDAASIIAHQTREDAAAYLRKIEAGETELKFVPLGSTYFNQERWNDGNEPEPTDDEIRAARIEQEIRDARSDVGRELDSPS